MNLPITVIIPHWFDEREANLQIIVEALMQGPSCPSQILIWNNALGPLYVAGAEVIQSPYNVGSVGRLYAALLARHPYIFFQDNDVCVQKDTLAYLYGMRRFGVVALQGRQWIANASYRNWKVLDGKTLIKMELVDVSLGRMELVNRETCIRCLSRLPSPVIDDDIWFSFACSLNIVLRWCLPYGMDNGFTELNDGGVGMSIGACQAEHYNRRDALCASLWRI